MELMVRGECGESKGGIPRCLEKLVKCMRIIELVEVLEFLVYLW
jgi:hypothetical protein